MKWQRRWLTWCPNVKQFNHLFALRTSQVILGGQWRSRQHYVEVNVIASALSDQCEKVASLASSLQHWKWLGHFLLWCLASLSKGIQQNYWKTHIKPSSGRVASNTSDNALSTVKPSTSGGLVVALQRYFLLLSCADNQNLRPFACQWEARQGTYWTPQLFFGKPVISETRSGWDNSKSLSKGMKFQ